uniref:Nucleoside 2-deoxyribosyltransferase n=1 Tax=Siphoviridae sp. ctrpg19 TaxID=2826481 RepID=A0A8S5MKQ6_9CAUD|nr:MAG TPA: Nucleoside 2-deoxyribosyltransferase [Siphoviridae sp. ctrpg19]
MIMIYLACSFACKDRHKAEIRKTYMKQAENILKKKGLVVYVPSDLTIPNAWDYTMQEWGLMVFANGLIRLDESDIVVMLSFGKENNAGSAWECGYAFAKGKKVIIVSLTDEVESLMVQHGSYAQLKGLEDLQNYDFSVMSKTRNYGGEES